MLIVLASDEKPASKCIHLYDQWMADIVDNQESEELEE